MKKDIQFLFAFVLGVNIKQGADRAFSGKVKFYLLKKFYQKSLPQRKRVMMFPF